MKSLVKNPEAVNFLELAHIDSGLRAMLGDPQVDAMVGPEIVHAHIALREGVKKVDALVDDPTRTDVDRHAAAMKVAKGIVERLNRTKTAIEVRATELANGAAEAAEQALGPRADRSSLYSEIRGWVRDQSKRSEGLAAIKRALKENDDVAAVLWHSPRFLLGLSHSMADTLKMEALASRKPAIYAKMGASVVLSALASKYDGAIRKVEASFYDPGTAAQAGKRVEV